MHRNVHVRFGGGGNGYPVLGARALPNVQAIGLISATRMGNVSTKTPHCGVFCYPPTLFVSFRVSGFLTIKKLHAGAFLLKKGLLSGNHHRPFGGRFL